METIEYIFKKYNLIEQKSPITLNIGREGLVDLFAELGFKSGAEIGVERGIYSEMLCQANPELKLYCVDAWKIYEGYRDHPKQDRLNKYYEETKDRLAPYNCEIIRDWSVEAARKFNDESLDFVYIDGNHDFQNCTNDIAEWSKKVRKGGIISGHDYARAKNMIACQVKDVVCSWTYAYRINPWFVVTGDSTPGDKFPSWFWVKI